ncbi:MAG: hypothetical protein WC501_03145 [Candidatus Micrarchaeia archaeon]
MDLNKSFEIAKIPIVILVVLGVIQLFLTAELMTSLGLLFGVIGWLILVYVGYVSTKTHKLSLIDAGLTGVVAGVVSGVVNLLLMAVFVVIGLGIYSTPAMQALGLIAILVGGIIALVIGAVIAFVLAIIGGFIGSKM